MSVATSCAGLSYKGWLYFAPRAVLDDLIERRMLKACTNHRTKFVMTPKLRAHVEASIWKEAAHEQASGERLAADAAAG